MNTRHHFLAMLSVVLVVLMLAWNSAAQSDAKPTLPGTAGEALKAGWKVLGYSTARTFGPVPNQGGGIHHAVFTQQLDYLLQKGSVFITCRDYSHNDTDTGKWAPSTRWCAEVE